MKSTSSQAAIKLDNEWKVVVPDVIHGYPDEPPYSRCKIVKGTDNIPKLMNAKFSGSLEECQEFAKNNCKHCDII